MLLNIDEVEWLDMYIIIKLFLNKMQFVRYIVYETGRLITEMDKVCNFLNNYEYS